MVSLALPDKLVLFLGCSNDRIYISILGYETCSITEMLKNTTIEEKQSNSGKLYWVFGNVVEPFRSKTDDANSAWILHSVDTGGRWGQGGLFTVLQNLSKQIPEAYNLAGKMNDLHAGDCHVLERIMPSQESLAVDLKPKMIFPGTEKQIKVPEKISRKMSVVLMVTQNLRDRHRSELGVL